MPAASKVQCWVLWLAVKFNLLNPTLKAFDETAYTCLCTLKASALLHMPFVPHTPPAKLVFRTAPCPASPFSSHCPSAPWPPCRSHPPAFHSLVTSSPGPALISSNRVHSCLSSPTIKPRPLPASLLWSLLIFTLSFSDLCTLLMTCQNS